MKTEQEEEINNALRRRLAEVMRKDEINNAKIRHMQAVIQRLQNENAREESDSDTDGGEFFDSKQH